MRGKRLLCVLGGKSTLEPPKGGEGQRLPPCRHFRDLEVWLFEGRGPFSSISQRMLSGRWDPPLMTSAVTSWRVLAGTALGSNHVASGLPNQDAVGSRATDDGATVASPSPTATAVPDMSGVPRGTPRRGDRPRLGSPFLERHRSDDPAAFDRALQSELSPVLVDRWQTEIPARSKRPRSRVRPTRSCHTAAHCCAPS